MRSFEDEHRQSPTDGSSVLSISLNEAVADAACSVRHIPAAFSIDAKGISAAHDRLAPAKLVWEFGPERPKGRVGFGRAALRGHLNRVGAPVRNGSAARLHRRTRGW